MRKKERQPQPGDLYCLCSKARDELVFVTEIVSGTWVEGWFWNTQDGEWREGFELREFFQESMPLGLGCWVRVRGAEG